MSVENSDEKAKDILTEVYNFVRTNYASPEYDADTLSIKATDRPTDNVHSGSWVMADTRGGRIGVKFKRGGVAGTPDKSARFDVDDTTPSQIIEQMKKYLPPSRVRTKGEVTETANPADVSNQIAEVRKEIKENDGDYTLPSETRGNMVRVRQALEGQYPTVEYDERTMGSSERVELRISNRDMSGRHGASARHSANWVTVTAEFSTFEDGVTVGFKRGGIAGNHDKRKTFSLMAKPDTIISQVKAFMRPR